MTDTPRDAAVINDALMTPEDIARDRALIERAYQLACTPAAVPELSQAEPRPTISIPDPELADSLTRFSDCGLIVAVALVIVMLGLACSAAFGGVTPDTSSEIVVVDGEGRSHIKHSAESDRWAHCFEWPAAYWLEFSNCITDEDEIMQMERLAPRPAFKPEQREVQ